MSSSWTQVEVLEPNCSQFKVNGLLEGHSYFFRLTAENQCGRGQSLETEDAIKAKLPFDKPSIPQNFRVTDVWKDYMMLVWEAPESDGGSPLSAYTLEQRDAYEVSYKFVASVPADAVSYQVTNLQEGHEYSYRIYSQNAAGLSEKPAEIKPPVQAKLPFEKPSAPKDLVVTATDKGSISVAWQAPENDGGWKS